MVAHIQVDFGNTRQYRKLQSSVSRMNQTRVLSNSERDITNVVRSMLKTSAVRNPDAGFLAKVFKLWRGSSFAAFMLLHLHNANCQSPASRDRTSVEVQVDSQLPLSNFQKLTSGTWTVTASSGTKMYHTWKWGPGRHSVERWTTGENAKGDPWAEMIVYYWHPQDKKIRFLGLSPFASGINTGEIAFDGSTAVADSILSQTTGKREMQTIWRFTASDKYTETLLEKSPTGKLIELVSLEHRLEKDSVAEPRTLSSNEPAIPVEFAPYKFLLGGSWTGRDQTSKTIRCSAEWMAVSNFINGTISLETKSQAAEHIHVILYRETISKSFYCLALSSSSDVYQGQLTTGDKGNLQAEVICSSPSSIERFNLLAEKVSENHLRLTSRDNRIEDYPSTTLLLDR